MRHQDWPRRLNTLIAECHSKSFAWGEHDCCLFAARAVETITGADPAADLRGTYDSELGAARILKKLGGVRGIATARLGEEIPPLMAQRGDIVMIDGDHGDTLAVCIGRQVVAPSEAGLVFFPLEKAVTAWRVN